LEKKHLLYLNLFSGNFFPLRTQVSFIDPIISSATLLSSSS